MQSPDLPRISIITACFNAQTYLEATLRSVLSQDYERLEYIVIDGASTDNSLAIARKHADRLALLKSEPDQGQYHGIQKGMTAATGDVMAWLNGDDVYLPWTLKLVGEIFARFPNVEWIIGTPAYMNAEGSCTRISGGAGAVYPQGYIRNGWFRPELAGYLQQESMFWRRSLWERVGGLNLSLHHAADFDLWRRFAEHASLVSVSVPLALFRQRPGAQRSSVHQQDYETEVRQVCRTLMPAPWPWRAATSRSEGMRHLCRLLIWKSSQVITYCGQRQQWVLTQAWRPLARTTWGELLLARSVHRN